TQHEGTKVEAILIDQAHLGEALRQLRASNLDLAIALLLQSAYRSLDVVADQSRVRAGGLQGARHDPLGLPAPCSRERAVVGGPFGLVNVPIAHELVDAPAVKAAGLAASLLDEVTKEHGTRWKALVIDVAVQRHVHTEDELRHAGGSVDVLWR